MVLLVKVRRVRTRHDTIHPFRKGQADRYHHQRLEPVAMSQLLAVDKPGRSIGWCWCLVPGPCIDRLFCMGAVFAGCWPGLAICLYADAIRHDHICMYMTCWNEMGWDEFRGCYKFTSVGERTDFRACQCLHQPFCWRDGNFGLDNARLWCSSKQLGEETSRSAPMFHLPTTLLPRAVQRLDAPTGRTN